MTKKKYLVTAFSSNLQKNKDDVITLKSISFKKNTNKLEKKQIVARNYDNNDVENFTKGRKNLNFYKLIFIYYI
jgi:hypothetical protein